MTRDVRSASSPVSGVSLPRRRLMLGAASLPLAGGLGGGALAWPASGYAATPAVAYAQGSIDPFFSAGYVALALGLFDGLDVRYINSQSGPRTNQLLAAGQVMFGATAATAAPALSLAGKPAKLIFGFDRKLTYANVIARRADVDAGRITRIEDLAGQRLGATQPQSSTWLMAKFLTERAGVGSQVDIRPLGDLTTLLGALKSGSVSAAMASMTMMEQAVAEGWGAPLFDATADADWDAFMGGDVPGIAAYALTDTIERQPDVVQAFVTGLTRAQDFITAHSAAEIAETINSRYLAAFDRASVEKTLDLYKKTVFLPDNVITPDAYARLTAIMGGNRQFSDAQIATVPYDTCVDMRFVRRARGLA